MKYVTTQKIIFAFYTLQYLFGRTKKSSPQVRKNCDRAESVHRFVRTVTEPNLSVCLSLLAHFKNNCN